MSENEENLVKKTCKELGITQKELAEKTKYSEAVISRWSKGSKISEAVKNHFNILIENSKLKKHLIQNILN